MHTQNPNTWPEEFNCGNAQIDNAHKSIFKKNVLLNDMIAAGNGDEDEMLELGNTVIQEILDHMDYEIQLLEKIDPKVAQAHKADHEGYKEKFDLGRKHSMSKKMRVLMIAEMAKEYLSEHFLGFDMKDLKQI
jgi:hemerythrin-like metal-binding protein